MNQRKKTLSVVIPCYRSEQTLKGVVEELLATAAGITELILVDDGSPDQVWRVIAALHEQDGRIRGVRFSRNFGQHAALMAGYRLAAGDYIVTMDDDGQSDPAGIAQLIGKLEEGHDVVYAYYAVPQKSAFRRFGSWLNRRMAEVMIEKPKQVQANSFFAMRRFVKEEIIRYTHSYPYVGGLVFRATQNIAEVEIAHRQRKAGDSGYTLAKLLKLWMNGFTAFSVLPLRMASYIGLGSATLGFVLGIVFVIRKLLNPGILLGYSSLIAVILVMSGIMMMMMGMIGEYVGRLYINSNCSPQYVIREMTENDEQSWGKADK